MGGTIQQRLHIHSTGCMEICHVLASDPSQRKVSLLVEMQAIMMRI